MQTREPLSMNPTTFAPETVPTRKMPRRMSGFLLLALDHEEGDQEHRGADEAPESSAPTPSLRSGHLRARTRAGRARM